VLVRFLGSASASQARRSFSCRSRDPVWGFRSDGGAGTTTSLLVSKLPGSSIDSHQRLPVRVTPVQRECGFDESVRCARCLNSATAAKMARTIWRVTDRTCDRLSRLSPAATRHTFLARANSVSGMACSPGIRRLFCDRLVFSLHRERSSDTGGGSSRSENGARCNLACSDRHPALRRFRVGGSTHSFCRREHHQVVSTSARLV
jgi:hypothetical protein